ncbi:hypothetical protein ARMGADRAFT_1088338 [Armillaria gallica]|uniref:Uncharacterized protein n=1 Tax=Armillaria gallica TaxID=47427 RepID=A0A2H3CT10_ARMGA|nr:hypothetical protein ARMGADRAFT_1088338 [Armillaria gallica]
MTDKFPCTCGCNTLLSKHQIQRHRSGKASPHILAAQALKDRQHRFKLPKPTSTTGIKCIQALPVTVNTASSSNLTPTSSPLPTESLPASPNPDTNIKTLQAPDMDLTSDANINTDDEGMVDLEEAISHLDIEGQAPNITVAQPRYYHTVIEDDESSGDEDGDKEQEDSSYEEGYPLSEDSDDDIPIWDMLNESFE